MLSLLHIENIAVIQSADISFDRGFNVLTGETGAGKSIVIDAISAIMGQRAYRDMIRTGADKAVVQGIFTDVPEFSWFSENGVDYDREVVIRRDIFLDGKNVCRVNGSLVSVAVLNKLGMQLINIHGQHDSATLFDEDNHLQFLDDFAENQDIRAAYLEKYQTLCALRREMDSLNMDEGEKLRRMETLRYQIEEITKANLKEGEDEALEDRRKLLQNSEKISDSLEEAAGALYGGDDTDGAAALLQQAQVALSRLGRYTDSFAALQERVTDLMYQVQDVAEEARDARDSLSYSADELEQIESRLDVIHRLRRKYRGHLHRHPGILRQGPGRTGRYGIRRGAAGTAEGKSGPGGKGSPCRRHCPAEKPAGDGQRTGKAYSGGIDPAGYAEGPVCLPFYGAGTGPDRCRCGGVLYVRQRRRSLEAPE